MAITAQSTDFQDAKPDAEPVEPGILQLLSHRYGDGLVYLRETAERSLYERAVSLGLISREGYLTRAGRAVLARYQGA